MNTRTSSDRTSTGMSLSRLAFLLLAVSGILLGILSMHSINLGAVEAVPHGHTSTAAERHPASVVSTGIATTTSLGGAMAAGEEECVGICGPELCLALGMACALALLFSFIRPRRALAQALTLPPSATVCRIISVESLRRPPTPSLVALSISRT